MTTTRPKQAMTTERVFAFARILYPEYRANLTVFEQNARQTIKRPVFWTFNRNLPDRVAGDCALLRSGVYRIRLADLNPEIAVHELGHAMTAELGLHLHDQPRPAKRYAPAISELFDEPPVFMLTRAAKIPPASAQVYVDNLLTDLKARQDISNDLDLALRYEAARRIALAAGLVPGRLGLPAMSDLPGAVTPQAAIIKRTLDKYRLFTRDGMHKAWYALRWSFAELSAEGKPKGR